MDDYISRQAALKAIKFAEPDCEYEAVEAVSSADVQPVRHGRWIDVNGDGSLYECDQCHDMSCCKGTFCPDCGARMDGEKNG